MTMVRHGVCAILVVFGLGAADAVVSNAQAYRCGQSRPCAGGYNPYNPDSYNGVHQPDQTPPIFGGVGTPVPGAGHKVIHSGQSVVVYHLYSLDPNCRSLGHYEITLLTQPHGGVVQTSAALDYPNFPQSNVRWVCDRRRSASDQIVYRASPGFTGEDSFEVEAISPEHNARRYQFSVTVE